MSARVLPLVAVAAAAIGCSVLVNTDFSGGREPVVVNKGGQAGDTSAPTGGTLTGSGGTFGDGATMSEGGDANASSDAGAGNEPGTGGGTGGGDGSGGTAGDAGDSNGGETSGGTGGDTARGGTSGGLAGSAGTSTTGGMGTGGLAGLGGVANGGVANGGGSGAGTAGMSGSGMAGGPGCDADLMTDPMHCGSCDKACADGIDCEGGICITSPCVGLCGTAMTVPLHPGDGYREDNIPPADVCFETDMYSVTAPALPSLICWNFTDRQLQVNGVTTPCKKEPGAALPPLRGGGYCVRATLSPSGDTSDGFKFPVPGQLMSGQ